MKNLFYVTQIYHLFIATLVIQTRFHGSKLQTDRVLLKGYADFSASGSTQY